MLKTCTLVCTNCTKTLNCVCQWCGAYFGGVLEFGLLVFAKTFVHLSCGFGICWSWIFGCVICASCEKNEWSMWLAWSILCPISWSGLCKSLVWCKTTGLCFGIGMNRESDFCFQLKHFNILFKVCFLAIWTSLLLLLKCSNQD